MRANLTFNLQRQRRRLKRDIVWLRSWTATYFNSHIWGRWRRLGLVRRLALVWWGILLVAAVAFGTQLKGLVAMSLVTRSADGGTYREGMVGQIKTINPILPESAASADVSRLIFSGLTRINPDRQVEGDLASSWAVSPDGKIYTFYLRQDVKWHDGAAFNARDVVFTLSAIQNPDSRSPLAASWQGVKAEAEGDHTVVFTLPNPYVPFIYSTTVGILPSHLLEKVEVAALRAASFNQQPVGTGAFKLMRFDPVAGQIQLDAYKDYYGGRPRLDHFNVTLYVDERALLDGYAKRQVTAIARLQNSDPVARRRLSDIRLYDLSLPNQTGLFLRNGQPILQDKVVRSALAQAVDRDALAAQVDGGARVSDLPLLPGQLGYVTKFRPPSFDPAAAAGELERAGWKRSSGAVRQKDGQPLKLRLVTSSSGEYPKLAEAVKAGWAKVGVEAEIITADASDLQQSYIRPRNYDVLLYGINLGADPDVYAYWHSSQVGDPGLNLSGYASTVADKALEGARLTADETVRAAKYGTFLAAWASDTPAIMLYTPNYVYAAHADARGITAKKLVNPADRFYAVEQWTVRTKTVRR